MNKLKQAWQWFDDRTGITDMIRPMAEHPVPPGAKWAYVFGSATLFCLILQIVTGVALSLLYQPTTGAAYHSLKYITEDAPLGRILRGIHYYGASAMILLVGLHMIRTYLTASFKYPREMSWVSGVILLLLTVAMGFTGQLLRWDSNGVWSSIVGAQQAGRVPLIGAWAAKFLLAGNTIGDATLSRFFSFHVFLVPALIFGLLGLHLFLVLRNGISEPPKAGRPVDPKTYRHWYENMLKKEGVPFWPDAAWRDMAFGLIVMIVIILLAVLVGPPEIGTPPNPADINTNPRPDWYLLWLFALFALMPPSIESYVMAFGPPIAILAVLLLPFFNNKGERSPLRRPWAMGIVVFIVMVIGVFWYEGTKSPWSPHFETQALPPAIVENESPEVVAGSELFYSKGCLYCHDISGNGGERGPELTHVGARLDKEQLTIKIVNGGGNMPAYGGSLSDKELRQLVSFLQSRK